MVRKVAGNYYVFPEDSDAQTEPVPIVMNETGYFIFEAKQSGLPKEELIRSYAERFCISAEEARTDILQTLGEIS